MLGQVLKASIRYNVARYILGRLRHTPTRWSEGN